MDDIYYNEAAVYFDDNELIVAFGDDEKTVSIELNTDEERAVVQTVLSDVNFWMAFLGALGQAMKTKMEQDIGG